MFRFLVLCIVFLSSNARRYHRRTRNYCYFRNAGRITRFSKSSTQFLVRNTFLQVETTLTAQATGWWRRRRGYSTGFFRYWLPNKAVVSSLRLKVKDRKTGTTTWYDGYVATNQQATQDFYSKFKTTKAQLVYRWTNEQFAAVILRTRFENKNLVSIVIGWEYAIELQYDRFQFDFPIPLPGAWSYSRLSVYGSIVEDGRPINSITVQSPGPMDLGNGFVIKPICERVVNPSTKIDCGNRTDVNQVDISLDLTYGQYRYWLSKRKQYRYPWWYYWQQWKQCSPHKVSHGSSSDSSEYRRGKNNLRKAIYGSNIAHDLVFSVTYNHTLLPLTSLAGLPPFYGAPLEDLLVNWVWGSDNDSCWMIGISAEGAFFQQDGPLPGVAPVQIFPVLRRATFFIDDNTGITVDYYNKVKAAVSRILVEAGTPRTIQQLAFSFLPDFRNFDMFRIVVLSSNGMVYKFPNVPAGQLDKFANATADLQAGLNFIAGLPDPPLCQIRPGFKFQATKTEFLNVMQEYTDFVSTLGSAGQNEISDVFYFANSKPEGTNGNFASNTRRQFLLAIRDKQNLLRAFTTRAYGQPIFTFGFGPNSDFNLLDAISSNNWGATTMAFADDSGETLEAQALQFYRGIGRVLMSRVNITNLRAVYGPNENSLFAPMTVLELNSSITDAGFLIPIIRDSQYINIVAEAPPFFDGFPIQGFVWRQDFVPGGTLQVSNIEEFFQNASRAVIRRPGDPTFGLINDKLNFTANFDDGLSLCKYGNVVRVHNLEAALRVKQMFPNDVTKSVAEINALIEKAGLQGGLQTSQTSIIVAQAGALESTEASDSQAYTASNTNSAFAVDVRFGLFVTTIVFSIVFY